MLPLPSLPGDEQENQLRTLQEVPFANEDMLSGDDLVALEDMVRYYLDRARGDTAKPTERAKKWRKYVSMQPPDERPFKGAPGIVTPIIRQKVDGVRAHIQASVDQNPMFVVRPRTASAGAAKPDMERLMQISMDETDSRLEIIKAIRDAVEVGTGHLKHVVYKGTDGEYAVASRYVPFEDIYVWPATITRTNAINYFERYKETLGTLLLNAERGVYDPDKVEQLIDREDDIKENDVEELWECWVRFRGDIYEVRYHEEVGILSHRKSTWGAMLKRAPYDPIYIEPSQNSYWGDSIPQILEGLQEVSDAAFNSEVLQAQFRLNPIRIVRQTSPAYQELRKKKFVPPGSVLPGSQDPRADIYIHNEAMQPFSVQMLELADKLSEEATISDLLVPGQFTGGRKTATEVNALIGIGQLKLTNYYRNVMYSLNRHANDKWRLVATYSGNDSLAALANSSEFYWEVNGKETTTEREMRLQRLQFLLNPSFLQSLQLSASNPFMQKVIAAMLGALGLQDIEDAAKEVTQGGMGQAQQNQAQAVAGLLGGVPQPGGAPGIGGAGQP